MESIIKTAIKASQIQDRIVDLRADELTEEALQDLTCEADDSVENGSVHEYWGEDEGGAWRVHVTRQSQEVG